MNSLSLLAMPVDVLQSAGPQPTSAAELARRGQISKTAESFEGSFLTTMLQTMMSSVTTSPPFGGGEGEDMWKSFLAEAMAKQMAKRGGIGISKAVEREMLKMQGLTDTPGVPAAATLAAAAPAKTPAALQ